MSAPSPDLFQYLDYQSYLRAHHAWKKQGNPRFSYREFAIAVNMDPSLLVKILHGRRHLSREGCEKMLAYLDLSTVQSDYFRELVAYGKATRDPDLRKHFENLLKHRPAQGNRIESDLYRYFQHWYYPAIRSALDVYLYRSAADAPALARTFQPALQVSQVVEAVQVLERLGFACDDGSGRLIPATPHLSTGERWQSAAVREYQHQLIQLAADSIQEVPKEQRDISTLTLALNANQLERIRTVLAEARSTIVRQVGSMPPEECNAVYQLNMQLFPIMRLEPPA